MNEEEMEIIEKAVEAKEVAEETEHLKQVVLQCKERMKSLWHSLLLLYI